MTVLYLLWRLNRACTVGELSSFPGLAKSPVMLALGRLMAGGMVTRETDGSTASYGFRALELEAELKQMVSDFQAVSFEGLSEEELAVYRHCAETVCSNITRHMLAEKQI